MVAQLVSTPIPSSLWHEPNDLTYVAADDILNIVTFRAPSKSRPGQHNTVQLDIIDGSILCDCKAAETGRRCWHAELVQAAWDGHPARILVAKFTDQQLTASGAKAGHMCRWARHRRFRVLPADALALLAARAEYRRRNPVAAEVAEAAQLAA